MSNKPRQFLEPTQEFTDAFLALTDLVSGPFRWAYKESGYPYGDTEEGYTRWLRELSNRIPDYRRGRSGK